jgi:hypothetical protein
MTADPSQELSILAEKLRVLQTLMRYERDSGGSEFQPTAVFVKTFQGCLLITAGEQQSFLGSPHIFLSI